MLEIIGGIFIGVGIETFGLISYILFKRRQLKPPVSYNEVFNVNIESEMCDTSPQNKQQPSIEYNDL